MRGLSLHIMPALVCSLCDQMLDDDVRRETRLNVVLGSREPFTVCPNCHQPTFEAKAGPEWQAAVREWLLAHNYQPLPEGYEPCSTKRSL